MAPRRKSKVGLTRMDAAVDALKPMGYPPVLVRKCVNDLLKVYGVEGWRFIEEDAYRVLIETVLEVPETPMLEDGPQQQLLEGNPDSGTQELVPSVERPPLVADAANNSPKQLGSGPEQEQPQFGGELFAGLKQHVPVPEQPPLEADAAKSLKQLGSRPEQERPQFGGEPFAGLKQLVPLPQQPPANSSKQLGYRTEQEQPPQFGGEPFAGLKQPVHVAHQPTPLEGDPDPKLLVPKVEPLEDLAPFEGDPDPMQLVPKVEPLEELVVHGQESSAVKDDGINMNGKKLVSVLCPTPLKTLDERIGVKKEKPDAVVPSTSLVKEVFASPRVGLQLGFAPQPPPGFERPLDSVGGKKNSNGWISDDE